MEILIILVSLIILAVSFCWGTPKSKILAVVLGVLFFPLGIILALTKKYK